MLENQYDCDQHIKGTIVNFFLCEKLTLNRQLLNASALTTAVVGGQGEPFDATTSTYTTGQNIVGVKVITTLTKGVLLKERPQIASKSAVHLHVNCYALTLVEELYFLFFSNICCKPSGSQSSSQSCACHWACIHHDGQK